MADRWQGGGDSRVSSTGRLWWNGHGNSMSRRKDCHGRPHGTAVGRPWNMGRPWELYPRQHRWCGRGASVHQARGPSVRPTPMWNLSWARNPSHGLVMADQQAVVAALGEIVNTTPIDSQAVYVACRFGLRQTMLVAPCCFTSLLLV